jgi:hypothetical protein
MSVDVFVQIVVGAVIMAVGVYMIRSIKASEEDGCLIVPLVFVISGWMIVVFAMDFNPFTVVAALLFILSLFMMDSVEFGGMAFIFAVIGGMSFAMGALSGDTENGTKLAMVTTAIVCMVAYWMFEAPVWTAIIAWTLFALVASTPAYPQNVGVNFQPS